MPVLAENKEVVAPQLAILIEDETFLAENIAEILTTSEISFSYPPASTDDLNIFFDKISDADLSRTSLVILDQGYNYNQTSKFLLRLRSINPDTLIIETSGAPVSKIHKESDGVFHEDWVSIIFLASQTAGNTYAKLLKLRHYLVPEVVEAQKSDENSEWYTICSNHFEFFNPHASLLRLERHDSYDELLSILKVSSETFFKMYGSVQSKNHKCEMLHHCWNILYLRATGSTDSEIQSSTTYDRLSKIRY